MSEHQQHPPQAYPPQPVTPLSYQVMPQGPQRPTAVTVIAIFVIILSALGLLAPLTLIPYFADFGQMDDPMRRAIYGNAVIKAWTIGVTLIGWVLAMINLYAAIKALKLEAWARRAMIKIASIQLVLLVIGLVMTSVFMLPEMAEVAKTSPVQQAAFVGGVVGAIGGAIIGAILPGLTIFFFKKPNVVEAFEGSGR